MVEVGPRRHDSFDQRVPRDVRHRLWRRAVPATGLLPARAAYSVRIPLPRLPIIASSSRRVVALSRKAPSMRLVTMVTPGLWTPRVVMH